MKLTRRNFLKLLGQATAGVLVAPKSKIFDLGKTIATLREREILTPETCSTAFLDIELFRIARYSHGAFCGMLRKYCVAPYSKLYLMSEQPIPIGYPALAGIVQEREVLHYRWKDEGDQ